MIGFMLGFVVGVAAVTLYVLAATRFNRTEGGK